MKAFPFGSEFTDQEITLGKALKAFKKNIATNKLGTLKKLGLQMFNKNPESADQYLSRMQLEKPSSLKEKLMQKTVVCALEATGAL